MVLRKIERALQLSCLLTDNDDIQRSVQRTVWEAVYY